MPRGKFSYDDDYDDGYDDYDPAEYDTGDYGYGGSSGGASAAGADGEDLSGVRTGSVVMGHYSYDGEWYQARVDDLGCDREGRTTYLVTYVEYGNSEELTASNIKLIPGQSAPKLSRTAAGGSGKKQTGKGGGKGKGAATAAVGTEKKKGGGKGAQAAAVGKKASGQVKASAKAAKVPVADGPEPSSMFKGLSATQPSEPALGAVLPSGSVLAGGQQRVRPFAFDSPSPDDLVQRAGTEKRKPIQKGHDKEGPAATAQREAAQRKATAAAAAPDDGGLSSGLAGMDLSASGGAAASKGKKGKGKGKGKSPGAKQADEGKPRFNLVVAGHVDSGKSTIMGRMLYDIGNVDKRQMHKFEKESAQIGKASFKYAWVLDETAEERERGVTIDVGITHFESSHALWTLLDAPGHRDFIPNMISGVAQADCGVLVVNCSEGEYETGLERGGQTREHAILLYTGGIGNLVVAMNKMDCCGYDEARYGRLVDGVKSFLRDIHFKVEDSTSAQGKLVPKRITFVPCSGLDGENVASRTPDGALAKWYDGPTLLDALDALATRGVRREDASAPLCVVVNDVYRSQALGLTVSGKVERGSVQKGDSVLLLPGNGDDVASVKGLQVHGKAAQAAFVGDMVEMGLSGLEHDGIVTKGSVVCDASAPLRVTARLRATIQVLPEEALATKLTMTQGYNCTMYTRGTTEECKIKLTAQLHPNGEVKRKNPRVLNANDSAHVVLTLARPMPICPFSESRQLGRFQLRKGDMTIATGIVTKLLADKDKDKDKGKAAAGGGAPE